jgi:hypothetical protein
MRAGTSACRRGRHARTPCTPCGSIPTSAGQPSCFYAQLLERVSALPGVRSAALGLCAPVSGGCNGTIAWFPPAKEPFRDGRDPSVGIHWITPGFLDTLGVKLLRGRNFTDQDRAGQPKVLLISETAARRLWPNEDPIGKRMWAGQGSAGSGEPSEVVGIVNDVPVNPALREREINWCNTSPIRRRGSA